MPTLKEIKKSFECNVPLGTVTGDKKDNKAATEQASSTKSQTSTATTVNKSRTARVKETATTTVSEAN